MLARSWVDGRWVPLAALTRKGEQHAEERREMLLDVREDHVPDRGPLARRSRDGVKPRERDERLGPGVRELLAQLGRRVKRIARDDDRARAQRAVEGDDELRAVGEKQRDAITLANTERLQPFGKAVSESIESGVAHRSFDEPVRDDRAEDDRGRPRVACGGVREEPMQGDRGITKRVGHARVVVRDPRALGHDPDTQPQPPARYRSTRIGGRRMPALSGPYGSPLCGTSTLVMVSTASRLSDSIAS
jgi:hypothetical protein